MALNAIKMKKQELAITVVLLLGVAGMAILCLL